jgi:hypothetical protein
MPGSTGLFALKSSEGPAGWANAALMRQPPINGNLDFTTL